jgi:NAD(P) transhydrogenase
LYANNVSKLLLSMQGTKDHYYVDLKDDVVRGSIILNKGTLSWPPNPPISVSAAPGAAKAAGGKLDSDFLFVHFINKTK